MIQKPKPPENRIECGWCGYIMPKSKFADHRCLPIKIGKFFRKLKKRLTMFFN